MEAIRLALSRRENKSELTFTGTPAGETQSFMTSLSLR
jgi:hypothetical protein